MEEIAEPKKPLGIDENGREQSKTQGVIKKTMPGPIPYKGKAFQSRTEEREEKGGGGPWEKSST